LIVTDVVLKYFSGLQHDFPRKLSDATPSSALRFH